MAVIGTVDAANEVALAAVRIAAKQAGASGATAP